MNFRTFGYAVCAFIVGASGGYKYCEITTANEELYPKCISVDFLQEKIENGWDINTQVTAVGGGKFGLVEHAIFDVACGADPVIDRNLAQFYLRNGGRISLGDLNTILGEAELRGYTDMLETAKSALE